MLPYRDKGICVNVDFFAGAIYYLLDIPDDLFISIFALGRIPRVDSPVHRAVQRQHPHPAVAGVHGRYGPGVRSHRTTGVIHPQAGSQGSKVGRAVTALLSFMYAYERRLVDDGRQSAEL